MTVYLSAVCLHILETTQVQTSQNFLYMLTVASRPRLEEAPYKAAYAYSALPYPSVTHTLAHIINQTPPLPGLAQWACYKKASAHGSRVGWTPARRHRTELWPWFGYALTTVQCVMYFRFCGRCHFAHNGLYMARC